MDKYPRHAPVDMKAYWPSANDPATYYGLPQHVDFCQSCVISNQRPNSTAEFTHTHGSRTQSTLTPAPVANSSFDTSESVQTSNQSSTSSRSRTSAECLICQLHQNLSNTLLGHALATASIETHSFAFNPDLTLHRADFSRSQRGRAPPVIL